MANQLVCKNPSAPNACQPNSSTPRQSSKNRGWSRKRNCANGNSVNTAEKSIQPWPCISDCRKKNRTTILTLGGFKDNHPFTKTFANANFEQIYTIRTYTCMCAHTCPHTTSMAIVCKGTFRERAAFISQTSSMVICFLALQNFL